MTVLYFLIGFVYVPAGILLMIWLIALAFITNNFIQFTV